MLSQQSLADPVSIEATAGPDGRLPLIIQPKARDIDLIAWAKYNEEFIRERLDQHGALLFRGFEFAESMLESFINATSTGALPYTERSSPRTAVSGHVYTSTDYPSDQSIFLHNEQSYNRVFPAKIYFMCLTPAQKQGSTPLADSRRIYQQISREVRDRFLKKKYMFVRNFGGGFGLHWRDVFQTSDRREVEKYCLANGMTFEWLGKEELRTKQVRDAIARHPRSGQFTWFNHLTFFHVSTLPDRIRKALQSVVGHEDNLPNNTYYGDGSPIENSILDELRGLYESEKVSIPWQRNDVLMLENMLTAHGREPFVGPRRVITGMADPCPWAQVAVVSET